MLTGSFLSSEGLRLSNKFHIDGAIKIQMHKIRRPSFCSKMMPWGPGDFTVLSISSAKSVTEEKSVGA